MIHHTYDPNVFIPQSPSHQQGALKRSSLSTFPVISSSLFMSIDISVDLVSAIDPLHFNNISAVLAIPEISAKPFLQTLVPVLVCWGWQEGNICCWLITCCLVEHPATSMCCALKGCVVPHSHNAEMSAPAESIYNALGDIAQVGHLQCTSFLFQHLLQGGDLYHQLYLCWHILHQGTFPSTMSA